MQTNWFGSCSCDQSQPYNSASYSLNAGSAAGVLIDAGVLNTDSISAANITLNSHVGQLTVNPSANIAAGNGSINIIDYDTAAGAIVIGNGATLTSTEGNVTIQNWNVTSGTILLDTNSSVYSNTAGTISGNVYILISGFPATETVGRRLPTP